MTHRFIHGLFGIAVVALMAAPVRAAGPAPDDVPAAVIAADDERVAASVTRDAARLAAVLSDDLRYAHSNGSVDTKASYIDSIVEGRSVYEKVTYAERNFKVVAPGVVLMSGRVLIDARSGEKPVALDLSFLAVWRLEQGAWRFVAWQSSRNPPK